MAAPSSRLMHRDAAAPGRRAHHLNHLRRASTRARAREAVGRVAGSRLGLGARLAIDWRIPGDVLDIPVPTLSLQPLVENAIKDGIASRIDGGAAIVETARAGTRSRLR
jgi:hypothetical protein